MVKATGVAAEFETTDGLRVEVYLRVTDEQGYAHIEANAILGHIEDHVAQVEQTGVSVSEPQVAEDFDAGYGWGL